MATVRISEARQQRALGLGELSEQRPELMMGTGLRTEPQRASGSDRNLDRAVLHERRAAESAAMETQRPAASLATR